MLMDYGLSEEEAVRIGTEMFDDPEGLWGLLDLGTVPQQEIIERYCRKYPADEKGDPLVYRAWRVYARSKTCSSGNLYTN